MLEVTWAWNGSLDNADGVIQKAIDAKLAELTGKLHGKVLDNLSGKILHKQTGQLFDSIRAKVEFNDGQSVGDVYVEPATEKAFALEKGGKGPYPIVPIKATVLRFYAKSGDLVFASYVKHPPSEAFHYLGEAFDEIAPIVPEEFNRALTEAIATL